MRELDIRVQEDATSPDKPPTFHGNPKSEAFRCFLTPITGRELWLRSNYQSVSGQLAHSLRICGQNPKIFIVHFQYDKRNAIAINTGNGVLEQTHQEYAARLLPQSRPSEGIRCCGFGSNDRNTDPFSTNLKMTLEIFYVKGVAFPASGTEHKGKKWRSPQFQVRNLGFGV